MPDSDTILPTLMRVTTAWRRWMQGLVAGLEITLPQLEVLRALDEQPSLNPSQLAEELGTERAAASFVLRNLLAVGWITITRNRDNAKFRDVRITARGRAKLEAVDAHLARSGRTGRGPAACLDAAERATFATLLARLDAHLAAGLGDAPADRPQR